MSETGAIIRPVESYEVAECDMSEFRTVYLLRCRETGRIKIGITDKPSVRIAELQRMSPTPLELLVTLGSQGNSLEAYFHRRYGHRRLHGEWFDPDTDMIDNLNEIIRSYWKVCAQWHTDNDRKEKAEKFHEWLKTEPIQHFQEDMFKTLGRMVMK